MIYLYETVIYPHATKYKPTWREKSIHIKARCKSIQGIPPEF